MKKKYETARAETSEQDGDDAVRCSAGSAVYGGTQSVEDNTRDVTDVYEFSWLSKL